MCIIGFQPSGTKRIPRATLARCREKNGDGMGIMYPRREKLVIFKGLDSQENFEELWNRYTNARDRGAPVGLHFRIATHGTVSKENCHPFYVYDDTDSFAFMHNGTITDLDAYDSDRVSDTRAFSKQILSRLPRNFLHSEAFRNMIESYIGYSKLLFMDSEGRYNILNESKGVWSDGTWWSNTAYRPYRSVHRGKWHTRDDDKEEKKETTTQQTSTSDGDDTGDEGEDSSYSYEQQAKDERRAMTLQERLRLRAQRRDFPLSADEKSTADQLEGQWNQFLVEARDESGAMELADPAFLELMDGNGDISEAEANDYGVMYGGRIFCYGCLPEDLDVDIPIFYLPDQEEMVYQCEDCRMILNEDYHFV